MSISGRKKQTLIFIAATVIIFTIDQFTKALILLNLKAGDSIPIIRNVLHITFVKNTGAAFGLFKNSTYLFIAISIVSIIFITGLILKAIKTKEFASKPVFNASLIIIVSGALGNLIDRIRLGYVVDFIDVRIWPVFNIADTSITIGAVFVMITFIKPRFWVRHPIL